MNTAIQKSEFSIGNTRVEIVMQGGFTLPGGAKDSPLHSHPNFEVHYVETGKTHFKTAEAEAQIGADTLLLIPQKQFHTFCKTEQDTARTSFEIKLSRKKDGTDTYTEYSELFKLLDSPLIHSETIPELKAVASCSGIISGEEEICKLNAVFVLAFLKICDILRKHKPYPDTKHEAKTALLPRSDEDVTVIAILSFIQRNFKTRLKLPDVANAVNLSERQVQRILSEKMNEGFHSLLTRHRITAAKAMLKDTLDNRPLEQISYECGFSSYVSFWKQFKKETSVTPEQYRRKYKKVL